MRPGQEREPGLADRPGRHERVAIHVIAAPETPEIPIRCGALARSAYHERRRPEWTEAGVGAEA